MRNHIIHINYKTKYNEDLKMPEEYVHREAQYTCEFCDLKTDNDENKWALCDLVTELQL